MLEDKRMESQLKFRLSNEMKQQILEYCQEHRMNTSEFIRMACAQIFKTDCGNNLGKTTKDS